MLPQYISTHAPLAGRDELRNFLCQRQRNFNPRAPCGARLYGEFSLALVVCISTHAPLAGRDDLDFDCNGYLLDFNPRAPCGARPEAPEATSESTEISTHAPLAGRDKSRQQSRNKGGISTHAPLAGRDLCDKGLEQQGKYFNPRAPCGARLGIGYELEAEY